MQTVGIGRVRTTHMNSLTGGSNGIGAATVRKFVAEGAYVYVVDIDEEGGVKVCQELDGNSSFVKC